MLIDDPPRYEITADDLASWLDKNARDASWAVDGDWLLTSLLDLPCPTDELTEQLRKLGGELLIREPENNPNARGQRIKSDDLDRLYIKQRSGPDEGAPESRVFALWWKDRSDEEWILYEDV